MKKSCFMTMLCASLMCIGLFSCEKDEVITEVPEPTPEEPTSEPEPAHYVDIAYTLNCSEDLLKYVIPQVTYMGDDGKEVTVQITDTGWMHMNNDAHFEVTFGDGLSSSANIMTWTRKLHWEEFPVDDEIIVSYVPKADMPEYEKTSVDLFYGNLSISSYLVNEENGIISSQNHKDEFGNQSYTLDETKEELLDRVDKTGEPYFFGTNGSNLIVGADQDIIEEVINLYWRKVVVSVDSNGVYSLYIKTGKGENE